MALRPALACILARIGRHTQARDNQAGDRSSMPYCLCPRQAAKSMRDIDFGTVLGGAAVLNIA